MGDIRLSTWSFIEYFLGLVIVFATWEHTAKRYRIALIAFTVIAIGESVRIIDPMLFGVRMANSFGPRDVSVLAYVPSAVIVAFFAATTYILYSRKKSGSIRWIGFASFLLAFPFLLSGLLLLCGSSVAFLRLAFYGEQGLLLLLLWLRVYDAKSSSS